MPTYLSSIPVQSSHFPLYIGQNPCTPQKFSRIINIVCTGKSLYCTLEFIHEPMYAFKWAMQNPSQVILSCNVRYI